MSKPMTARHDLTIWRNDDYYEYPIRVVGLDLTDIVLKMEIRFAGDTPGPALVSLLKVTQEAEGVWFLGAPVTDGVPTSLVRIRMNRATIQSLSYDGVLGDTTVREYALLIGGRTRMMGRILIPPHAYGSNDAPAKRGPGKSVTAQTMAPDTGATMTLSADGGVTLEIDGADMVAAIGSEASAAAEAAKEALVQNQAIATTSYRAVAGYAEREAIPLAQRGNGMRVLVVGQREFEWNTSLYGPGAWTGLLTEEELTRRQLQHGTQGQDTIDGLPATLAAQAAAIGRIDRDIAYKDTAITAFTVAPAIAEVGTTVNAVTFHLEESGSGPFAKVITRGDGQTVWWLKSASRDAIAFADATISTDLLTVGDSLLYDIGPTAANAAGLNLANPTSALYSQTIRKQALRIGVYPIAVTLAGGTLPASGATGTVTTVNGQPTTFANPDAFLHASGVDTDTHAVTGALVGRQVTITYNPNKLDTYAITQANGAAVAVPAGSIFVPDFAAMMSTREVWLLPGHNSMSLSSPAASFEEIRTTIDAMMAKRGTNRTLLMIYWLAEVELSLLPYLNDLRAYLRKAYPANYVVDAQGRDTYDILLANSSDADRARGLVSANLRRDDIHPNATGIGLIKDQIVYFRNARMAATMALKVTTDFTLSVNGKVRTASVRFFPRRFWGVSASDALTKAQVIGLAGSELSDSRAKAFTVNPAGQYVYYAYLASLGDPTAYKGGGFNEQYVKTIVSVTTAAGLTADYIVLRSLNKLTGAASVEVQ